MRNPNEQKTLWSISSDKVVALISLSFFIVGSVGYFLLQRDFWLFYFFAHLGALGVMGLSGSAAGSLARKKYQSYTKAFFYGFLLPINAGVVVVLTFLWGVNGGLYCGGSVSLVVALLVILYYLIVKKNTPVCQR